jgi:transcription termination factor Rho
MEMFMTADQSSGTPKRVTRRRTKKVDTADSGELRETGLTESQAPKPVIEDVFDEIRDVRRQSEGYPTEQEMDFEALDEAPAPRRGRARRSTAAGSTTAATGASETPRRGRAPRAEVAEEAPAPRENVSREVEPTKTERFEPEQPIHSGGDAGAEDKADFISDALSDVASGGSQDYPSGPEGFPDGGQNRRRRRRRGRGRGANLPEGGGYGQSPQRPQQGRHNQQQARGHRRGGPPGRPQFNTNGRTHSEPRNQQDRGPERERGPEVVTPVQGILELHPKGYGFLRDPKAGYVSQETDAFVSGSLLEKYGIREGVLITGESIPGGRGQGPRLRSIQSIEGRLPEQYAEIKNFDALTPINPHVQIKLETGPTPITMRVMDLLTPIGKGQRALIVAPPRTGKTMLLQEIADAVSTNYPDIYLIVLLIDERPEEVTEMRRRVKGEVVASSLDREVENHIRVSQLVFERAKRMAESGRDVFVLLDSITRTARAFNKWTNTGRTGTGGLDVKAMDIPKKMFGMARQFDEGGSLTVVGTALIETGSRMDEAIFLEFKGTGNMEMVLSRELSERRIWPAIDISRSGTRREEKILSPDVLEGVTLLRRSLVSLSPVEAMEQLTRILQKYPTNADFLAKVRSIL